MISEMNFELEKDCFTSFAMTDKRNFTSFAMTIFVRVIARDEVAKQSLT